MKNKKTRKQIKQQSGIGIGGEGVKEVKMRNTVIAMAAVFVLLAAAACPGVVYGAKGIEVGRPDCSITFDLSVDKQVLQEGNTEGSGDVSGNNAAAAGGFNELGNLKIPVKLYKVANVTVSGKFEALDEFSGLGLIEVNSSTTAAQWESMARDAMGIVNNSSDMDPIKEIMLNTNEGNTVPVSTGLYLVAAGEVKSAEYIYNFTPYLVSVPGNAYNKPGDNDDWIYDVEVSLKPGREIRYGDLVIEKTLNSYNATLGEATFVFKIEAEKDGENVYSDVVSIVFGTAGTRSVEVKGKIPAGAEVKVTEIYKGASYELTGSEETQIVKILANDDPDENNPLQLGVQLPVKFVNDYDERLNLGVSVVNHFEYTPSTVSEGESGNETAEDGTWANIQQKDSTGNQEQVSENAGE